MFRWLEDFQQQNDASLSGTPRESSSRFREPSAEAQAGARISNKKSKELHTRSPSLKADSPRLRGSHQGKPLRKQQQLDSPKCCQSPCVSTPSPTSRPEVLVTAGSGGTTNKDCLSDEQLQELVLFFVYLDGERSRKTDDCDASPASPTASEAKSFGCEDDLDLSEGQLKALRKKLEAKDWQERDFNSTPKSSEFGDCPMDCGLSDEQLSVLSLYYDWYKDNFAAASADSDFGLSAEKLHKLQLLCQDDITSSPPKESATEDPQTNICEFGLSDAHLQNLVCFNKWVLQASKTKPDDEFGLSSNQMEEIKKYYGWCQGRRQPSQADRPSSGLSEEQLEKHQASLSPPQLPFTDQELQDLVFLFIWSGADFDCTDMEGCDDDIDLNPKQLEQLKRKCAELAGQGRQAFSSDAELKMLATDICIEQEQLVALIQYCAWASSPEATDLVLSAAQLRDIRARCKVGRLQEARMRKDSSVSDERLQNLVHFYNWRCSTLGATECDLDDGFGLSDEHFGELIQYLVWCERRAMATTKMSPTKMSPPDHDVSCSHQNTASPPIAQHAKTTLEGLPLVQERQELDITEASGDDCSFDLSDSEVSDAQPMGPRKGDQVPVQGAYRRPSPKPLSPASDSSMEGRCMTAKDVGRPAKQPVGKSASRAGSAQGTPPRSPSSVMSSQKSLPTPAACGSKMREPTVELDNSFESQGSTPRVTAGEKQSSPWKSIGQSKPTDVGKQSPVLFSIFSESEAEVASPTRRGKRCKTYESVNSSEALEKGDAGVDVGSPHMARSDSVIEDPIVSEFLAKQRAHACSTTPSMSALNLPSPRFPLTTNGGVPSVGGQRVPSPAAAQQRQNTSPRGESAGNNPSTVLVGSPDLGSEDVKAEMEKFVWATIMKGHPGLDRAPRARGQLQQLDEFSDDDEPTRPPSRAMVPPRAFPSQARGSRSPCRPAQMIPRSQTFCVAPQPAETWGWDASSWFPWRAGLLRGLTGKCTTGEDGLDSFEELHADH